MKNKVKINKVRQLVEKFANEKTLELTRSKKELGIKIHNEVRTSFNHKEKMMGIGIRNTVTIEGIASIQTFNKEIEIVMVGGSVDLTKPLAAFDNYLTQVFEKSEEKIAASTA